MAYTEEEIDAKFTEICDKVAEGQNVRDVLKFGRDMPAPVTFYKWLESSDLRAKQYAHAHEVKADREFQEILEIADNANMDYEIVDGKIVVNGESVQRSKLRVDARKWRLSKMLPKKYGDSVKLTGDADNPIQSKLTIEILPASGRIASSEGEIDAD